MLEKMNHTSPYNCTIPGNLFVGYHEMRDDMLQGLHEGHSYAILGGKRCGKTSLLLQLERDVRNQAKTSDAALLPKYLDVTTCEPLSASTFFHTIYTFLGQECPLPEWRGGDPEHNYQTFLDHLDQAKPLLDAHYDKPWVAVLFLDDLDTLLPELPDDQFFYDLGSLLTSSPYQEHFRVMTTGTNEMSSLIFYDNAPLANLQYDYLRVLDHDEIEELILAGFPEGLDRKTARRLYRLTGGHPFLLQGLLEVMWQEEDTIDDSSLKRAKKKFLKQHNHFDDWLAAFALPEHVIYQRLLAGHDEGLALQDLREGLDSSIADDIDGALTILSFHGLINDHDPEEPRIAGTLFRDWYQDHCPLSSIETIFHAFHTLAAEVETLTVAPQIREQMQNALTDGLDELTKPDYEGQPQRESLISAVQRLLSNVKQTTLSSADQHAFLERLRPLASALGIGIG